MFERSTKDHIEEVKYNLEGVSNKLALVDRYTRDLVGDQRAISSQLMTMERRVEGYFSSLSDDIDAGLNQLSSAFGWGIAKVVHQLELQRGELRSIVEALSTPLETEARELRRRAEFAYQNGWFDEALSDFRQVVAKNYSDFVSHQLMGNIFLNKNSLPDAQACYERAAKYARPQSPSYAAYALWHIGRVLHLRGDNKGARSVTAEALRLNPRLLEAQYDLSRYCALLGETQEGVGSLRTAIEADPGYCIRALGDDAFDGMKPALQDLFVELRDAASRNAREDISRVRTYIHECKRIMDELETHQLRGFFAYYYRLDDSRSKICWLRGEAPWVRRSLNDLPQSGVGVSGTFVHKTGTTAGPDVTTLLQQLEDADGLLGKDTYLDSLEACNLALATAEQLRDQFNTMKENLELLSTASDCTAKLTERELGGVGVLGQLSGKHRPYQMKMRRLSAMREVLERTQGRASQLLDDVQRTWPVKEDIAEPLVETVSADIGKFAVRLTEMGERKIEVIKVVHKVAPLGLKEAKDLVESAPQVVREGITREVAEAVVKQLERAGATAHVVRME